MNTVLNIMDKLYSNSDALKIVYVVGAVLLFIFVVMLIISLRKPEKEKEVKIIEEPKIDDIPVVDNVEVKNEEVIVEEDLKPLEEQSIFEKTRIIPLDELRKAEEESVIEETTVGEDVIVDTVSIENDIHEDVALETVIEEGKEDNNPIYELSKDIPDVDSFVDNVVKKSYERNEQFSSVYVGNANNTKLDKVMDSLNVDEDIKESILSEEEITVEAIEEPIVETTNSIETDIDDKGPEVSENTNSLDALKKALDEKKKEVELKQNDLKAKLEGLKQVKKEKTVLNDAEELLNKFNEFKEN